LRVSDFPTIVYRSPGRHSGPPGKTYDYKGIANEIELTAALTDGWLRTLPEACAPPPVVEPAAVSVATPVEPPADDAPPTREELKAKAADLGLDYDGRISDARLLDLINKAIDAKG
jgi:hypothetical protein